MKESIALIQYKYEHGGYSLEQMIELVKQGELTEKDFHDITRQYYD